MGRVQSRLRNPPHLRSSYNRGAMHRQNKSGDREFPWKSPLCRSIGTETLPSVVCKHTSVFHFGIRALMVLLTTPWDQMARRTRSIHLWGDEVEGLPV